MNTIFWHDYETTGASPSLDRPLQFAGVRTDEELNEVAAPVMFYCKPSREILPHPEACLITGITPQQAEREGLPEPEFIASVVRELAVPGTCGAGYNSIRFDDEVTRYSLYRNFFDPYEREWQNGNSRWDIIDMLRLTHALRPEGIHWPMTAEGAVTFRLEELTKANGIAHDAAHDALSDVRATIAMARLVRERQPRLYDYVYQHRTKHKVAELLDVAARKPFLHVSSRLPRENAYTALMIPLCAHPQNGNAIIAFNLLADPRPLLELSAGQIKERVFAAADALPEGVQRLPLKAVHINRCPVVATTKLLDSAAAARLGIDIARCETHWALLKDADVAAKLAEVFTADDLPAKRDPELALYDGFPSPRDKALFGKVRAAAPQELAVLQTRFQDPRYRELLFRYRARFHPECLSEQERVVWEEQRYQMLAEPLPGRLGPDEYFARLDALDAQVQGERDRQILASLSEWGDRLLSE
ncbi:MAG: exodeoxyribonuclease I [Porticoccaceae bacterium]